MFQKFSDKILGLQVSVSRDISRFKCYDEEDLRAKNDLYRSLNKSITPMAEKILFTLFQADKMGRSGVEVDSIIYKTIASDVKSFIDAVNNLPFMDYDIHFQDYELPNVNQRSIFAPGNISL